MKGGKYLQSRAWRKSHFHFSCGLNKILWVLLLIFILGACGGKNADEPDESVVLEDNREEEIMPAVKKSDKKMFMYPTVINITPPAAGNFPQGAYHYRNPWSSIASKFMQTLEWIPEVDRTFETNTQYTAVLTLEPADLEYSFADMLLEHIKGLPEENVAEKYAVTDGDNMIIHIVFNKTASVKAEAQLLFFDEFDGDELDKNKWAYPPRWDRQGRSSWDDGLVSVGEGYLSLGFVRDEELGQKKTEDSQKASNWIRAGAVRTLTSGGKMPLFENTYGFYEARIKFPKIRGTWGAFWLMSPTNSSSDGRIGMEIDIVESIDNHRGMFNSALHWGGYSGGHKSLGSKSDDVNALGIDIYDGDFHTFALEWSPTAYVIYVDGKVFWRRDYSNGGNNRNPNYIKLSVEGADWSAALPEDFTEGEMLVDYVRVYNQPRL